MTSTSKSPALSKEAKIIYLALGIISVAGFVFMVMFFSNFFWITLPFMFTFLAKGADLL